jgi:hypothetical protein
LGIDCAAGDVTDAWEIIANAKALLLDFDGPITALMPAPINAQAADRARAALRAPALPGEILTTTDHLAVLRFTAERYPESSSGAVEADIALERQSLPSARTRETAAGLPADPRA